jgi:hypothetical protein
VNDRADYQAAFDQHGEAYVREMFEAGRYSGMVADEARHWLAKLDRARSEASQAKNAALAREADSAARDQADAAREANRIAKQANTIAVSAAIIAIVAIAISLLK